MLHKLSFLILIFLSITTFGQENPYETYKIKWNGEVAPNFVATDINGNKIEIEQLKNKVILLNFWFTSCSGCKLEYPGLQTLKNRFKPTDDVVFISVANDEKEYLTRFLEKNPLNFVHIANGKAIADEKYSVLGYPTNIIIDKEGIIRHIKIGGSTQSADDIEYEMKHLLK